MSDYLSAVEQDAYQRGYDAGVASVVARPKPEAGELVRQLREPFAWNHTGEVERRVGLMQRAADFIESHMLSAHESEKAKS